MNDLLTVWWLWIVAALILAIIEVFVPAFVFLGMAIGAVVVGVSLGFGLLGLVEISVPMLFLLFAVSSVVAALGLRAVLGVRRGQVKHWDTDINE